MNINMSREQVLLAETEVIYNEESSIAKVVCQDRQHYEKWEEQLAMELISEVCHNKGIAQINFYINDVFVIEIPVKVFRKIRMPDYTIQQNYICCHLP